MIQELYHATDLSCAKEILNGKFIVKANFEHWLGNGIYFYPHKDLADWWLTNPSKKYGVNIKTPTVLKVKIDIPDEKVLDLRKYSNFEKMIDELHKFYKNLIKNESVPNLNWNQIVCSFFNYYFSAKGVSLIIGCFEADNQPYNKTSILRETKLKFVETQFCLLENAQKYIISKEIV